MRRRPPGRNSVTASEYLLPCLCVCVRSQSAEERTSPGAVGSATTAVAAATHPTDRRPYIREVHGGGDDPDDAEEADGADQSSAGDWQRQEAQGGGDAEDRQPQRLRELAGGREGRGGLPEHIH